MNPMQFAIEAVGGQTAAARLCGLSNVAIHKWVKNAALPRTEYTEKTNYSQLLAEASNGQFTADWLLQAANPDRVKNESHPRHADPSTAPEEVSEMKNITTHLQESES